VITATRQASKPVTGLERIVQSVKGVVLGNPFASSQAIHERLTKFRALPVFSSDALSSSAYGPEETLLALAAGGAAALVYSFPIAVAIVILLGIVTISYRQTIKAYPNGGGAYIVAHENLGSGPGLTAAGALMVDYILTVSVSVAAGVAAITSAFPDVQDFKVPLAVFVVAIFTIGNLRGVRESGAVFGLPTYFFVFAMSALIVGGLAKILMGEAPAGLFEHGPVDEEEVQATTGISVFLILKAFSSGCSALTGVEAISNGVPAFQPPESKNARTTLSIMAGILAVLVLGVSLLAYTWGIIPSHEETVLSQLGKEVFGGENLAYYALQAGTAMVLFLAANTAYADFPRLGSILAHDRFMPRHFAFRGDKLAFSNGILLLALSAIVLLIVFNAEVTRLIPLYAVGVFVSFTLSQTGMVVHWLNLRGEAGWRSSLAVNLVGALSTGLVAIIIASTKFLDGAWISIALMGVCVALFALIRRHYDWYERVVAVSEDEASRGVPSASPREAARDHVVVPVEGLNKVTVGAIGMARAISSNITAVHLTDDLSAAEDFKEQWERVAPDVPLLIIDSPYRAFSAPMLAYMDLLERTEPDKRITVILPGFKAHHWWESLLHNQAIRRLRPFLEEDERIRVVDFDYDVDRGNGAPPAAGTPVSV